MKHDRNGNEIDVFGIPTGSIDHDPTEAYTETGEFKDRQYQEILLRDALLRAGVELGDHDDRIVRWFADLADWSTFATVTSWINRSNEENTQ